MGGSITCEEYGIVLIVGIIPIKENILLIQASIVRTIEVAIYYLSTQLNCQLTLQTTVHSDHKNMVRLS